MKKTLSSVEQMNAHLKTIMDILRRDKAKGPLEYIPELTWMMFLRLLDEKEIKEQEEIKELWLDFSSSLSYPYRWQDYAWKDIKAYVFDKKIDWKKLFEMFFINFDDVKDLFYSSDLVLEGNNNKFYLKYEYKNIDSYKQNKENFDNLVNFLKEKKLFSEKDISIKWKKRQEIEAVGWSILDFVNDELFPYLKSFHNKEDISLRQKIIGIIFSHFWKTKVSNDTNLLDIFDKIHFISEKNIDENQFFAISQIYESLLLKMGDKNSDGGQFFTPRPVIKAMIELVNPRLDCTYYDPCCGTGGFLAKTYRFLYENKKPLPNQLTFLKEKAFYGKDNSDFVFPITLANLVIHGIDYPHIWNENTITGEKFDTELVKDEPEQFDYIFTNPPFGWKENIALIKWTNFLYKTSNTQVLFIQHVLDKLKYGGECALVIDEWVLFRTNEEAFVKTKEKLLNDTNLHTIVSLPAGVFSSAGAGVKTNLLFFKKWDQTENIFYFDMSDIKVNKSNPLTYEKFQDFLFLAKNRNIAEILWKYNKNNPENDLEKHNFDKIFDELEKINIILPEEEIKDLIWKVWFENIEEIKKRKYDLSAHNPNIEKEVIPPVNELLPELKKWFNQILDDLNKIEKNYLGFNK